MYGSDSKVKSIVKISLSIKRLAEIILTTYICYNYYLYIFITIILEVLLEILFTL